MTTHADQGTGTSVQTSPEIEQTWLYVHVWEGEAGEQPHRTGSGALGRWQIKYESTVPVSQKGPEVHQAQHHQLVEGGDCPTLLCTAAGYSVQFGNPPYKKDIKLLECVQRGSAKMMKDLEGKTERRS